MVRQPKRHASPGLAGMAGAVELFGGVKLGRLLEEHMPKKRDAVDAYRGFWSRSRTSAA